ncbi:MAG: hypothetical protein LBV73_19840 [Paraburkholderia sp.]|nr:hypothetical protein [Paraburkholderia sp.]
MTVNAFSINLALYFNLKSTDEKAAKDGGRWQESVERVMCGKGASAVWGDFTGFPLEFGWPERAPGEDRHP